MKRMKRFLYLCLFMIVLFALGACGKKSDITGEMTEQLKKQGEALLNQLYQMNDAQLAQVINDTEKGNQNQQAFLEGLKSFQKGNQIMFDLKDVHEFLEKKKF